MDVVADLWAVGPVAGDAAYADGAPRQLSQADDIRIYDAALSPSDIKRVMHGFQPLGRY